MAVWINRTNIKRLMNIEQLKNNKFVEWAEEVYMNNISTTFYINNEEWFHKQNGTFMVWLNRLYRKKYTPKEAAEIIERAFRFKN